MKYSFEGFAVGKNVEPPLTKKDRDWFRIWGVALLILGAVAVTVSAFTTLISVFLLGILILASGVVLLVDAFTFWWRKWKGFFLNLLLSGLYIAAGVMFITHPLLASVSLTLFLGVFYGVLGIYRIIYSLYLRMPRWGWVCFNGCLSLLLGVLILAQWPQSGLYIIGLFVGIDLLFTGWAYTMASLPKLAKSAV